VALSHQPAFIHLAGIERFSRDWLSCAMFFYVRGEKRGGGFGD
jgi:hypothetical protein